MNRDNKTKKLTLVVGPTAVGKTDRAIELAIQYQCEIISCDSRQLYRELNIGVAKPDESQLRQVTHHFINHISIHQPYDAGNFAYEGRLKINELFKQFDNLVVCGGTGLYVKALIHGLDALPGRNEPLRQQLEESFKESGIEFLQEKLRALDIKRYRATDANNPQRLIRAIEIASSDIKVSQTLPEFEHDFKIETILLNTERVNLYDRINKRVDKMIDMGLEKEARELYPYRELNALQTVGYREWWPYFEGMSSKEEAIEKIKQHSRNYAKRQLTWFRNQGVEG